MKLVKSLAVKAASTGANFLYFFLKLLPNKNKITFISRGNTFTSIDFKLLSKEIKSLDKEVKIIFLNHPIENKIIYIFKIAQQMFNIATSRAVILDTYNIPISILSHRKGLAIIQIWHALGAFKSFGLLAIGKSEGSSQEIASAMKMHKNYTYVSCASETMGEIYQKAFGVSGSEIVLSGSPRVDYLKDIEIQSAQKKSLREKYSIPNHKKVILFTPTFRKNSAIPVEKLISEIDFDKFVLVFRKHPLDRKTFVNESRVIIPDENEAIELLAIADYLITDYSAVVFEAVVMDIPCYFWVYDQSDYKTSRGFLMDFENEAPGKLYSNPGTLIKDFNPADINSPKFTSFKNKYLQTLTFNNSQTIAELALKKKPSTTDI